MRIAIASFRGEVPRLTPRALPGNAAQAAVNAKLVSGDLEPWRQFAAVKTLTAAASVQSIYLLNDRWLSWPGVVDVARASIAGDTSYRIYLTAPSIYSKPRWTNYSIGTTTAEPYPGAGASSGAEPYPVSTRPIGVPNPSTAPAVAVDVAAVEESNVTLTNPGAEVGTSAGWTVDLGSLVVFNNGDIVGLNAQAGTRFFGGGNVAASESHQDVALSAAAVLAGQSLRLAWYQATGAAGSTASMGIEFYDATATIIGTITELPQLAPSTVHTWERRELTVNAPDNAVTARLIQTYTRVGAGPALDAYIDSITLNTVDYSNSFDGSTLSGWDVSPTQGSPGSSSTHRRVELATAGPYFSTTLDWAATAWRFGGDGMAPWVHRDFNTDASPAVALKFKFQNATTTFNGMHVKLFASAAGAGATFLFNRGGILLCNSSSWDDASIVSNLGTPLVDGEVYTISMRAEKSGQSEAIVTIDITDSTGATTVANLKSKIAVNGPHVGFVGSAGSLDGWAYITSVFITVTAPKPLETVDNTATSYVYRFVNDVGEASGPSPASVTVVRPDGGSVIVTTPTTNPPTGADAEHGITYKQIYRAVSGASGTAFFFVAQIPLSQADYTDSFDDTVVAENEVLDSEGWDVPLADMEGIIALPNGIMAGFSKNRLCLSVAGHPHAWRVADRHTTDTAIVAIANIDNTIVVGTKRALYTATGTSNDSYTLSAPGVQQACTAKRGMVFLDGVGIVYPSPDGWMACSGSAGLVQNITEGVFSKKQWQALDPSSIVAAVHDGAIFWFSTGQTPDSGYMLDVRPNGAGLVSLSFHALAAFVDPVTDNLYLVMDAINEPTEAALPVASSAPVLASPYRVIHQFDGHATDLLRYRYRGKFHLLPYPAGMTIAQVHASDFANLVLRTYGSNGTLLQTKQITSETEFTVPALAARPNYELELVGTSTVRQAQLAEDVTELMEPAG